MNRRDLIRRTTVFGAVAGISALSGCGQTAKSSEAKLPKEKPMPLPVPSAGMLPAAFVLGKDAEVLDFCGPLEVFAGASTKDGKPLFAPYMVAAASTPVTVGGGMKVLPDHTFKTSPPPKLIVIPAMDVSGAPQEMYDWIRDASAKTDVPMSVCTARLFWRRPGCSRANPQPRITAAFTDSRRSILMYISNAGRGSSKRAISRRLVESPPASIWRCGLSSDTRAGTAPRNSRIPWNTRGVDG